MLRTTSSWSFKWFEIGFEEISLNYNSIFCGLHDSLRVQPMLNFGVNIEKIMTNCVVTWHKYFIIRLLRLPCLGTPQWSHPHLPWVWLSGHKACLKGISVRIPLSVSLHFQGNFRHQVLFWRRRLWRELCCNLQLLWRPQRQSHLVNLWQHLEQQENSSSNH